ncbi:MAG: hypothetical protein GF384_05530 [Elusimicrobia bacterium]|nr:hypothetical protein [Elusimicrobiota bacterium]MBD3412234.1 hypothetical protein [Elusimicrobiota bacterium]
MKNAYIFCAAILCMPMTGYSISIPLGEETRAAARADGALRIGVVDMELIFREFPETRRGRQDLEKEIQHVQKEITEREKEIAQLEQEVEEMKSVQDTTGSMPGMNKTEENEESSDDNEAVTESDQNQKSEENSEEKEKREQQDTKDFVKLLNEKESLLKEKKKELTEFTEKSKVNILAFEERKSKEILDKLYRFLSEIAKEENIDIILDKSYVLYGKPAVDVTEKLRRRLSGN